MLEKYTWFYHSGELVDIQAHNRKIRRKNCPPGIYHNYSKYESGTKQKTKETGRLNNDRAKIKQREEGNK